MEDVCIEEQMKKIVDRCVHHYKSDFEIDQNILRAASAGDSFLWLVRECGTYLLPLHNVLLKTSPANIVARYYSPDEIKYCCFVRLNQKMDSGLWMGDMISFDYKHLDDIMKENECPIRQIVYLFEDGKKISKDVSDPEKWKIDSSLAEQSESVQMLASKPDEERIRSFVQGLFGGYKMTLKKCAGF
jgi:hypothetical protein